MDALVKQCEAAGEAVKTAKAGGDAADIKAKVAALVKISAQVKLSRRVSATAESWPPRHRRDALHPTHWLMTHRCSSSTATGSGGAI